MPKHIFPASIALSAVILSAAAHSQQSAMDQFNSVYGSKSSTAGSTGTAPGGSAVSIDQIAKIGHKLDIVGVYLGMPAKAAIADIHAHNPRLSIEPNSFKMNDVPDQTFTSRVLFQTSIQVGGLEIITIELTTQPMQPLVAQVYRHFQFNESNHPTVEATVAALRAKYGHESDSRPKDATHTYTFFWFYDEGGQQVTGQAAKMLSNTCTALNGPEMQSMIVNGFDGKNAGQDCSQYSVLEATVEEWGPRRTNRQGQSEPPGLVFQMDIGARSIPLQIAGSDATRKMLFAAREARQSNQKKAAGQNTPVL